MEARPALYKSDSRVGRRAEDGRKRGESAPMTVLRLGLAAGRLLLVQRSSVARCWAVAAGAAYQREQLEADVRHYEVVVAERDRQIAELTAQVEALKTRVKDLEERLGRTSRNSSKPPSSDGPALPPRPKKPPTGRRPGGQPGHERHERELVPPEKVNKIVECIPQHCECCDMRLHGEDP